MAAPQPPGLDLKTQEVDMGRRRRKSELTKLERQIVTLNSHRFEDEKLEEARSSLVRQYITRDTLTRSQQHYIGQLAGIAKKEKRLKIKHENHYLYAIQCGDCVKIGHAADPTKRLAALQTANPEELSLKWKTRVGSTAAQAKAFERKLHKEFKDFHIRGEWFAKEILEVLQ